MAGNDQPDQEEEESTLLTGLKAITICYKDMHLDSFKQLKQQYNGFETEESRQVIENEMTMIASLGLSDPLRENIDEAIAALSEGKTNVRIISGDHKASVMAVAFKLHFIEEINDDSCIMSSDELYEKLAPLMKEVEDTEEGRGKTFDFVNPECKRRFKSLKKEVRLVYRASPLLKHMLVCAFR
jgi:magnesium-transporting ATPase (P-type)